MGSRLLKPMDENGVSRFQRTVDGFFSRLQGWYERRLHGTLDYRPVTAFLALVVLLSCGYLFRSAEHTSELQSLMRISYAVFCLKKKNNKPASQTQLNCS